MADEKPVYGPNRTLGDIDGRAQLNPSGRTVIRCRRRKGFQEVSFVLDPDEAERVVAVLTATIRDARTIGGGHV